MTTDVLIAMVPGIATGGLTHSQFADPATHKLFAGHIGIGHMVDAGTVGRVGGKAAAFAADDILLFGQITTRPDGQWFKVHRDFLSHEPCAIALRRDHPDFSDLVRRSFERMAADGTLHR